MNTDLIARLEKASGPDRELANEVLFACGWKINEYGDEGPTRSIEWVNPDPNGIDYLDGDQPDPTASIDAALTLVPSGKDWLHSRLTDPADGKPYFYASIDESQVHYGSTPAIAICIAALKARAEGRT